MSEKLQKVLARSGFGSRREMEAWIEAGRVSVNGTIAKLGDRVEEQDIIRVDGRTVSRRRQSGPKRRVIAYHKPIGEMVTRNDPEGRATVFANLPFIANGRWIAVGRLDINTAGLLLLTSDGELANRLMHPSVEVEREYAVRVFGEVDQAILLRLQSGVELEDGTAKFDTIVDGGGEGANHWYHVTLREGRNREVRRLWESQGVRVSRLTRVRYGPIMLNRALRQGAWRELDPPEIEALLAAVGMQPEPAAESAPRRPRRRPPGARPRKRR